MGRDLLVLTSFFPQSEQSKFKVCCVGHYFEEIKTIMTMWFKPHIHQGDPYLTHSLIPADTNTGYFCVLIGCSNTLLSSQI